MSAVDTLCIELTAKCPLQCIHCSANASPRRMDVLPSAHIRSAVEELAPLTEVYLSGGEPFEHPDLLEIVHTAVDLAGSVIAYSSGTSRQGNEISPLPRTLLIAAKATGLSRVDLSIYAANATAHDTVTCTPGSFAATLETARLLRSVGLPVGIHFVPIGEASEQLPLVSELALSLGVERVHVLALAQQGRASSRVHRLAPTQHFWQVLTEFARSDHAHETVLSSSIRRQIRPNGQQTARDRLETAFLDVHGFVYPGEGHRRKRLRSRSSILSGSRISDLIRDAKQAQELAL